MDREAVRGVREATLENLSLFVFIVIITWLKHFSDMFRYVLGICMENVKYSWKTGF